MGLLVVLGLFVFVWWNYVNAEADTVYVVSRQL